MLGCLCWLKQIFLFRIHLLTKLKTVQNWYHFSISKFWSIWSSVLYGHCCLVKVTNSLLVTCVEEQHNNTTILYKSWVLTECLARIQYRAGYCRAGQAGWWDLGVEKQNNYVKQSQVCGNSWEQTYYKGFIFINLQQPLKLLIKKP